MIVADFRLFIFSALITSLTILTGCQDEDFGFTQEEVFRNAYERNFIKTYGEIDPNQSWDFSACVPNTSIALTRADGDIPIQTIEEGKYYVLPQDWKEDFPTRSLENFACLNIGSTSEFYIIPIFQDMDGTNYSLEIICDGTTIATWKKGENVQYLDKGKCTSCGGHGRVCTSCNGKGCLSCLWKGYHQWLTFLDKDCTNCENGVPNTTNESDWKDAGMKSTDGKIVRTKPIAITPSENTMIFFNISYNGQTLSSLNGKMKIVEMDYVNERFNIDGTLEAKVIACEIDGKNSDFNEQYFLLVGKSLPTEKDMSNGSQTNLAQKRYMVEDFGSQKSYDFNDIVIDLTEKKVWMPNTQKNGLDITTEQNASVYQAIGTLPFKFFVGDVLVAERTEALDEIPNNYDGKETDKKASMTSNPWIPGANNVRVEVSPTVNPSDIWTSQFPDHGAIPYIIATPSNTVPSGEEVNFNFGSYSEVGRQNP